MSSGMLLLAGLFATGPAGGAPLDEAPMPRAKAARIAVEFRVDLTPRGLEFGAGVGQVKPLDQPRLAVPTLGANPAPSAGPPPEVRVMMLQALEQMACPAPQPPLCLPQQCLQPAQVAWSAPPPVGRTMMLGSWTREVGPVRYQVEFKGDTLVVTTSLTETDDQGKPYTVDHVLTAEWYPTRNEHEIVGLVKGFDIATTGKAMKREDATAVLGSLAEIQKQLNGKPIALTCRFADGALMIGDVRLPALKDDLSELSSAFAAMGGNYKSPTAAVQHRLTPVEHRLQVVPPMPLPQPLPRNNPFRNGGF